MAEEIIDVLGGTSKVPQREVALLMEAGYLLMELSKHAEAEEVFTGVSALLPHSEVPHIALGNLHFSLGRWNQALKAHKKALELNTSSGLAHAHLGEVLLFMKKSDEAVKELHAAIELEGEDALAAEFAKQLLEAHEVGVFEST